MAHTLVIPKLAWGVTVLVQFALSFSGVGSVVPDDTVAVLAAIEVIASFTSA